MDCSITLLPVVGNLQAQASVRSSNLPGQLTGAVHRGGQGALIMIGLLLVYGTDRLISILRAKKKQGEIQNIQLLTILMLFWIKNIYSGIFFIQNSTK